MKELKLTPFEVILDEHYGKRGLRNEMISSKGRGSGTRLSHR